MELLEAYWLAGCLGLLLHVCFESGNIKWAQQSSGSFSSSSSSPSSSVVTSSSSSSSSPSAETEAASSAVVGAEPAPHASYEVMMRQHSRAGTPAATATKARSRQPQHPYDSFRQKGSQACNPEENNRACICAVGGAIVRVTTTGVVSWLPGASSDVRHRMTTATQCRLIQAYPQASAPQRRRRGTLSASAPSCSSCWASSRLLTRLLILCCPLGPAPSNNQGYGIRTHTNAQAQAPCRTSQKPALASVRSCGARGQAETGT